MYGEIMTTQLPLLCLQPAHKETVLERLAWAFALGCFAVGILVNNENNKYYFKRFFFLICIHIIKPLIAPCPKQCL
jgi:hypothetical protein